MMNSCNTTLFSLLLTCRHRWYCSVHHWGCVIWISSIWLFVIQPMSLL